MPTPEGVFQRIESPVDKEAEAKKAAAAQQAKAGKKKAATPDLPDILRVDMRVGKILSAGRLRLALLPLAPGLPTGFFCRGRWLECCAVLTRGAGGGKHLI